MPLTHLRALIHNLEVGASGDPVTGTSLSLKRSRDLLPCPSIGVGGIPRGALIEVLGPARTDWVVRFLSHNPLIQAAWIEERFSLLPTALQQRKVRLEQVIFVEAKENIEWTATTLLGSQLYGILVITGNWPANERSQKTLRRFQLFAERSNSSVFLLSEAPSSAWSISLQLKAWRPSRLHPPEVKILRQRGLHASAMHPL